MEERQEKLTATHSEENVETEVCLLLLQDRMKYKRNAQAERVDARQVVQAREKARPGC